MVAMPSKYKPTELKDRRRAQRQIVMQPVAIAPKWALHRTARVLYTCDKEVIDHTEVRSLDFLAPCP
jgi:hypothetical protein